MPEASSNSHIFSHRRKRLQGCHSVKATDLCMSRDLENIHISEHDNTRRRFACSYTNLECVLWTLVMFFCMLEN